MTKIPNKICTDQYNDDNANYYLFSTHTDILLPSHDKYLNLDLARLGRSKILNSDYGVKLVNR